jgi:hypothetical protein
VATSLEGVGEEYDGGAEVVVELVEDSVLGSAIVGDDRSDDDDDDEEALDELGLELGDAVCLADQAGGKRLPRPRSNRRCVLMMNNQDGADRAHHGISELGKVRECEPSWIVYGVSKKANMHTIDLGDCSVGW